MSVLIDYTGGSFETEKFGETVGTITGQDIDLSTGNVFNYTPTADTTFTFSNPPTSGTGYGFTLNVTGANVSAGYDLANAASDGSFGSFAYPTTVALSDDGTILNVVEYNGATYSYDLSTPYDITTASLRGSNSTLAQYIYPIGGTFIENGTKFIINNFLSNNFTVFNCSTPFDLSSSTKGITSSSLSNTSNTAGVAFDDTGTKLFVSTQGSSPSFNNRLHMYTLSTPFDVSTLNTTSSALFDYTPQKSALLRSFFFKPDGKTLYISSTSGVFEYSLSTAWDITTITFTTTHSITNDSDYGYTNSLGTKLYFAQFGAAPQVVYQVSTVATPAPATFTYPSSVKWPSGNAPSAPAAGETDVLTFYTTDGGTTWYGNKVGDTVS